MTPEKFRKQISKRSAIVITLLVWLWFIPSGYFWGLAIHHDILLPILPKISWFLPGFMWINLQWVFIVAIFILPIIFILLIPSKKNRLINKIINVIKFCLIAFITISLIWGIILLNALY